MQRSARFRFYEELNDFLPVQKKKVEFEYQFRGSPAIKDVIEAIGVPHPEVDLIIVNGESVKFNYHIQDGDYISVYPVFESIDITPVNKLRPRPLRVTHFICDVNLGKLARWLRLCGFDTLYECEVEDNILVKKALEENRIILSRDQQLLKRKEVLHGYWVRDTDPNKQLTEVVSRFDLKGQIIPFIRCLECNGNIATVNKKKIADKLLPRTRQYFDLFYQCNNCHRIYWQGSHYENMMKRLQQTLQVI